MGCKLSEVYMNIIPISQKKAGRLVHCHRPAITSPGHKFLNTKFESEIPEFESKISEPKILNSYFEYDFKKFEFISGTEF